MRKYLFITLVFVLVTRPIYSQSHYYYRNYNKTPNSVNLQQSNKIYNPRDIFNHGANGIKQGQFGDCWFEASLASVANTRKGQQVISQMIIPTSADSYEVTFKNRNQVYIVTDDDIKTYPVSKNEDKWAQIIEVAMLKKIYGAGTTADASILKININGNPIVKPNDSNGTSEGLMLFTGNQVQELSIDNTSLNDLMYFIQNNLQMQNPMICASKNSISQNTYIIPNHAFSIVGYDMEKQKIKLRNPWKRNYSGVQYGNQFSNMITKNSIRNDNGYIEVSLNDFLINFATIWQSQF